MLCLRLSYIILLLQYSTVFKIVDEVSKKQITIVVGEGHIGHMARILLVLFMRKKFV